MGKAEIFGLAIAIGIAIWVWLDVKKLEAQEGWESIPSWLWGIIVFALMIVALPVYLYKRHKFKKAHSPSQTDDAIKLSAVSDGESDQADPIDSGSIFNNARTQQAQQMAQSFVTRFGKKKLIISGSVIAAALILWIAIASFWNIGLLAEGSLYQCPQFTVTQLVESSLTSPKWEQLEDDNGNEYVRIEGRVNSGNHAFVQILFAVEGESFELSAMRIDGKDQPNWLAERHVKSMCNEAEKLAEGESQKVMDRLMR